MRDIMTKSSSPAENQYKYRWFDTWISGWSPSVVPMFSYQTL